MDYSAERIRILEMIDRGQINAEEGLRLLAELQEQAETEEDGGTSPFEGGSVLLGAVGPGNLGATGQETWGVNEADTAGADTAGADTAGADTAGADTAGADTAGADTAGADTAGADTAGADTAGDDTPVQPEIVDEVRREDFERWKRYWMAPVWIGAAITVLGGLWMFWALESSGLGFWFFCATIPFAIGVLVLVIGAESRNARWLHLRIQQAPGERPQRIALSFPLPIRLTAWFLRTFRTIIPGMENVPADIDQVLTAMGDATSPENPIYIKVDDDEDGDKVEIYIG